MSNVLPSTMTAVRLYAHGGPDMLRVEEVPVPAPGSDEVLVHVHAAAVSWWDTGYRKGIVHAPPGRPALALPFQLGREGAGEVAAIGGGVNAFSVGERVVIMTNPACGRCAMCLRGLDNLCLDTALPGHQRYGTYAQYVLVPSHGLLHAPDHVPFEALSCVLWSYGTALHMVDARASVRPGDSVLVTGASSGMGTAGLQLARLAGAHPIIGLSGSPAKAETLLAAGADVVLDYREPDAVEKIHALTDGLGVDVVLDMVGGAMVELGMRAARMGGRVVLSSIMGGRTFELHIADVFRKHLDILGTRASTRSEQQSVLKLLAGGRIAPVIGGRFPLREAARAHAMLDEGGHVGKVLLLP